MSAYRLAIVNGVSTKEAIAALKADSNVDRNLIRSLEGEGEAAENALSGCIRNSFPATTRVLLADGSSQEIASVRVGDQVLATDPSQDGVRPQAVTATFAHDTERLVDVALEDGGSLSSTAGHRFWTEGGAGP
ncbi:Hint domain-containing protein [Kitasatospora aburaviensis]